VKRASVSLTVIISAIAPPSKDCGHEKKDECWRKSEEGEDESNVTG